MSFFPPAPPPFELEEWKAQPHLIRPRLALDPYSTGVPGLYIGSAATPPCAGIHGMSGYNAARSALRHLRRT